MRQLFFGFICLVTIIDLKGQNKTKLVHQSDTCLSQKIFKTNSLGNSKESLPFSLIFKFSPDSLRVCNVINSNVEFLTFEIEKLESCQWNKDFTVGKTSYQLLMVDKQQTKRPKLNIIYEPNGKKYIELLYENSEERIFTIAPQQ